MHKPYPQDRKDRNKLAHTVKFGYIGIRVAQIKSGKGMTARIIARVFDVDGIALQLGIVELAPPLLQFAA